MVDLAAERVRIATELREIAGLISSMRMEVARSRAREEQAATPDERVGAIERRAAMAAELATLEAKHEILTRFAGLLESVGTAPVSPVAPPSFAAGPPTDEGALLRAVVATQEEERRRIARAVHDGPAQAMANVVLQSEISERVFSISPESARSELATLRAMVNKTLQELRGFIFELRPMILDDLGLVPTLRRYLQTIVDRQGTKVDFTSTGRDRRLPPSDEIAVFRLLQDALVARVQGAGARDIHLALAWHDDALEIQLRSDGGPVGAGASFNSGLTREERISLLAGTVAEEQRDGQGVLTVRVPIASPLPTIG